MIVGAALRGRLSSRFLNSPIHVASEDGVATECHPYNVTSQNNKARCES